MTNLEQDEVCDRSVRTLTRHRYARLCFVVFILNLFVACDEAQVEIKQDADVYVSVDVMLSKSGIRVSLSGNQSVLEANQEYLESSIRYEFKSGDTLVASGKVPDPRIVRAEFDENMNPAPRDLTSNVGAISLRLPDREGSLTVYDGDRILGSQQIARFNELTLTQELMTDADIVTPPTYIRGSESAPIRLLFVSEGYLESELGSFREDVHKIVNGLAALPEYTPYASQISAQIAEVRSPNSGLSTEGNFKRTAFQMQYNKDILCQWFQGSDVYWDTTSDGYQKALALLDRARATVVVVISNTSQRAACATRAASAMANLKPVVSLSRVSLSSSGGNAVVLAHELGHAVFGLNDEYNTPKPSTECQQSPGGDKNISYTSSRDLLPWADLVAASTPLPTPWDPKSPSLIGAYEGGGHCAKNRWRPEHDCRMRSVNSSMCRVCRREMERGMWVLEGNCAAIPSRDHGRGCYYSYDAAPNGATTTATTTTQGHVGTIALTCTNGKWVKTADSCRPALSCAGSTGWSNGLGCIYKWSETSHGRSASAENIAPGHTGTISATCNDGKWIDIVDTCQ